MRITLLLLITTLSLTSCAQQQTNTEKIYSFTEVPATFIGGEDSLITFLQNHIGYPNNESLEGKVIIRFVVDKTGKIEQPNILRGLSKNLDAEALRVANMLPNFNPALQEGKPVKSYYILPFTFQKPTANNPSAISGEPIDPIIKSSEIKPVSPLGNVGLGDFIKKSIQYPEKELKMKKGGTVEVEFVIEKTGKVSNVKALNTLSPALDAEAVRVINSLPDFEPVVDKGGRTIRAYYTLPVTFVIP